MDAHSLRHGRTSCELKKLHETHTPLSRRLSVRRSSPGHVQYALYPGYQRRRQTDWGQARRPNTTKGQTFEKLCRVCRMCEGRLVRWLNGRFSDATKKAINLSLTFVIFGTLLSFLDYFR
jgi:hypothetical protein